MQTRLFVRDFGQDTDVFRLEELFSNVGTVQKAVVQDLSTNGVTRRVAYIEMSSAQEALDCIDRFHGMKTDGHILTVTEDKPHVPDPHYRAKRQAALEAKKRAAMRPKKKPDVKAEPAT